MTSKISIGVNPLGDIRAENDEKMLDVAFCETIEYKTLVECADRNIVVGRRGTGKSALFYKLKKYWIGIEHVKIIELSPEEDQIIGIRPLLEAFGPNFKLIRAGSRIAWKYALCLEIALKLKDHYKFNQLANIEFLRAQLKTWEESGRTITERFKYILKKNLTIKDKAESQIGELAKNLHINEIQDILIKVLNEIGCTCVFLIDRFDEGYDPDEYGVGLIDGMITALIDMKSMMPKVRPIIFLRDNIFRAIAKFDPDYSRNIEGQVLRLHWDEHLLLNLVCQRIRTAFKSDIENNQKLWDRYTSQELKGKDGFKGCLKLTLYRPRDILALLNEAFLMAARHGRDVLANADIESTAKQISTSRLEDLCKEYAALIPGLDIIFSAFFGRTPDLTFNQAKEILDKVISEDRYEPKVQQSFRIINESKSLLLILYSIGFVGIQDKITGNFVFCHDGSNPEKEINQNDKLLIHPCYWMALNLSRTALNPEDATEIYDEYAIQVTSLTPQLRARRVDELISTLNTIPLGEEGHKQFENWCFEVIKILFAGILTNIALHPNKHATQRRDVVATNLSKTDLWKRIREDYGTRQVVFEVKNYIDIGASEARQMLSYLSGDYGNLGFIITRDDAYQPRSGKELDWIREIYNDHKKLIIKLTGKYLITILTKVRTPGRYDAADDAINKLLDNYARLYLKGVTSKG